MMLLLKGLDSRPVTNSSDKMLVVDRSDGE